MPLNFLTWLLALLPVLTIIILMFAFNWGGTRAGALGWIVAVVVAVLAFGAGWRLLAYAQVKSILLSTDVLLIIWTALLLYNIANQAGAIRIIGERLPTLTSDRVMQVLLVSWLLVSFIQGMGGFGVPIAVCAPILVAMGFSPLQAVVMAALGHGWGVNFGSMATAFQALLAVTGLPAETLAPYTALFLGAASLPSGMIVAYLGTGWQGLKKGFPAIIILSLVMGVTQYFLATNNLYILATTGAAMAGMLVCLLLLRLPMYRAAPTPLKALESKPDQHKKPRSFLVSVSAYVILVLIGFFVSLVKPVNQLLNQVRLNTQFPALSTSLGWQTPAEAGRAISIFGHPGMILLYACLISYGIYRYAGYLNGNDTKQILGKVYKSGITASLAVISMVSMATIMNHSGMINLLARGISESVSRALYPAVAPFLGVLGAFITGSNNNSNVLFGVLQMETARLLDLPIPLILAAQTAGGSLGSIMSPAKVIVGCSTVGLVGKEAGALRKIILFGLIPVALVAILSTIFALGLI